MLPCKRCTNYNTLMIAFRSKNLSGKDQDLGSTRLPPVPPLAVKKLQNPEYQYFKMTYNEVPKFR